jgi:uncharacterized membrane protein
MDKKKVPKESWGKKLRGQFLAGILVVVPIAASIAILVWVFNAIDNILKPVVIYIFGNYIPGIGFAATIIIIYIIGIIAKNVIGKNIIHYLESLLAKVPVFRQLSSGIRQILESFTSTNNAGFMQVVLTEFPKDGIWTIGFVTNEIIQENGEKLISVMIPTSPTPWSGFLQILKEKDIIRTTIPIEDALKMIVSCGITIPKEVQNKIHLT